MQLISANEALERINATLSEFEGAGIDVFFDGGEVKGFTTERTPTREAIYLFAKSIYDVCVKLGVQAYEPYPTDSVIISLNKVAECLPRLQGLLVAGEASLPDGGTTGQALIKNSNTNQDASWQNVPVSPSFFDSTDKHFLNAEGDFILDNDIFKILTRNIIRNGGMQLSYTPNSATTNRWHLSAGGSGSTGTFLAGQTVTGSDLTTVLEINRIGTTGVVFLEQRLDTRYGLNWASGKTVKLTGFARYEDTGIGGMEWLPTLRKVGPSNEDTTPTEGGVQLTTSWQKCEFTFNVGASIPTTRLEIFWVFPANPIKVQFTGLQLEIGEATEFCNLGGYMETLLGAGDWVPPVNSKPLYWWDSTDANTMFLERTGESATTQATVGGLVGTWRSKGTADPLYATCSADAERPTRQSLHIQADVGKWLSAPLLNSIPQPYTILALIRPVSSSDGGWVIHISSGATTGEEVALLRFNNTNLNRGCFFAGVDLINTAATTLGVDYYFSAVGQGVSSVYRRNGVAVLGNAGTRPIVSRIDFNRNHLGTALYSQRIYQVMIFDKRLGDSEIVYYENFLRGLSGF
jgi:hypothetical protein